MLKVMFVDDDINVLDGFRRMLRKMKDEWNIVFLRNGKEALDEMKNKKYDVIICDYKMPEMDGLEVLRQAEKYNENITKILLTGQPDAEVFENAREVADYYIEKPCETEELINIIKI